MRGSAGGSRWSGRGFERFQRKRIPHAFFSESALSATGIPTHPSARRWQLLFPSL
jgi:hypothetical protein